MPPGCCTRPFTMPTGARGSRVKIQPTTAETKQASPRTPRKLHTCYEHIQYSAQPPKSAKHALQIRKQPAREAKYTHPGFYLSPKTPTYSSVLTKNIRAKCPPACKRNLLPLFQ